MFRNFRKLLSANIISGVLGLITLSLVLRGLGAELFGVASVTISVATFIEQLAGFQAWQAVVKFASEAKSEANQERFWNIVSTGLALDAVGCLISASIGIVVVWTFSELIGIPETARTEAALYMLSLVCAISGTPLAVLRIYEHYDSIGRVLILVAFLKFVLIAVILFAGINLAAVLAVYGGTMVLQHLILTILMLRVARKENEQVAFKRLKPSDFRQFPGFARFVSSVYLSTTFRYVAHELDTIILSAASGPAVAGQYKLAKQYGSIVFRAVEPAQQVIYPRIASMVASREFSQLAKLLRRLFLLGIALSALIATFYFLVGPRVLQHIVGAEFDLVPTFFGLFLIAALLFSCFFFMRPVVLSLGRADSILGTYVIATCVFLLAYFLLRDTFGPTAMMLGQIAFYMTWVAGMSIAAYVGWKTAQSTN